MNVLIYGAAGYSGERIARLAAKTFKLGRVILAGRTAGPVRELAHELHLDYRVFALDDHETILSNLSGIKLVVNAAGPFAKTAEPLAKAAIQAHSHYVDINGEIDVYMKLDDLARQAQSRRVALVCSAGHTAGASCLLLDHALRKLAAAPGPRPRIGAIRIALSMLPEVSRGSAVTGLRLVREQVLTIRRGERVLRDGRRVPALVKWHEPVGRLERIFDFGGLHRGERRKRGPRRLASAANMTDTLAALHLLESRRWTAESIESYLQMDPPARAGYQAGAIFSSLMAMPGVAAQADSLAAILTPEHPTSLPARQQEQVVVLEIEGVHRERLIEWRLRAASGYEFTARLVLALMTKIAQAAPKPGWQTPAEILYPDGKSGSYPALETFEGEGV